MRSSSEPKTAPRELPAPNHATCWPTENLWQVAQAILHYAKRGVSRTSFLQEASRLILRLFRGDVLELRLWGDGPSYRWCADNSEELHGSLTMQPADPTAACHCEDDPGLELVCEMVAGLRPIGRCDHFTAAGSYWTNDCSQPVELAFGQPPIQLCPEGGWRSIAVVSFAVDDRNCGLLLLYCRNSDCFQPQSVETLESLAKTLGMAISDSRARSALRERIKELTCLYGITQLVEQPGIQLDEILAGIVELLPPAMQYPEAAVARLAIDGREFRSAEFRDAEKWLSADVVIRGLTRGTVAVGYAEPAGITEEETFLSEEQALIDAVAGQVGLIVERKLADAERTRLEQQLRHADRLATIGQLASGIAHELNEPLGSILGFAQLATKAPQLPEPVAKDLDKIIKASLHAREVIKKLMLFARPTPLRTSRLNLNELVQDGLYFLEGRCTKNGVEMVRNLASGLPEVKADPAQILQVLVNLVVNAIQAMPHGGRLTISTASEPGAVLLTVEDTGVGMSEEVQAKAFLPFFTTKQPNEGTGLGLPVVHGIVTSHGGTIEVTSKVGIGSLFTVRLPVLDQDPEGSEDERAL